MPFSLHTFHINIHLKQKQKNIFTSHTQSMDNAAVSFSNNKLNLLKIKLTYFQMVNIFFSFFFREIKTKKVWRKSRNEVCHVNRTAGAKYCKRHFNQYLRNVFAANKITKRNEVQNIIGIDERYKSLSLARYVCIYRTNFRCVPLNKEMQKML